MGNEQTKVKVVSASELQTFVMIIQAKLTQNRNKKVLDISKKRNEIRDLLKEKGLELAKAKMETILQEEDNITVYDILGTLLEKIKEKCSYMLYYDKCPEDLRATLDTIIYASTRLEIDELHAFRNNIKIKYGDEYILDASSNKSQLANVNVVEKLRMKVPQEQVVVTRLKMICKEFDINYVFPQEIQPMTNLFPPMQTGQFYGGEQMHVNQNFGGGGMGGTYDPNYSTKTVVDDSPYNQLRFTQNQPFNPNQDTYTPQQQYQNFPQQNDLNQQHFQQNQSQSFGGGNQYQQQNNINQSYNPNINPNLFQNSQGQQNSFQGNPNNNVTANYPKQMDDFPDVKIIRPYHQDDGFPKAPES